MWSGFFRVCGDAHQPWLNADKAAHRQSRQGLEKETFGVDRAPPRVSGQRMNLEGRPLLQSGLRVLKTHTRWSAPGRRNCATQRKWALNAAKSRRGTARSQGSSADHAFPTT